jgi:hypothetical protein
MLERVEGIELDTQLGKLRLSVVMIGFIVKHVAYMLRGGCEASADVCHQTGHIPVIPFDQFLCPFDSDLTWDSAATVRLQAR